LGRRVVSVEFIGAEGQVIRKSEYQVAGHQESRVAGRRISGEQGIREQDSREAG
jgi:hypothetical protein